MTSWAAGSPAPRSPRCNTPPSPRRKGQAISARLIVHAVFTDSPFTLVQAEEQHRGHAQAGQVFADWTDGPLARLPSGCFPASAAWLALAAISCNLLRAAGAPASLTYNTRTASAVARPISRWNEAKLDAAPG